MSLQLDPPLSGLIALGYTARQAAFLALVASCSGYFLRRQYTAFLGKTDGALTTTFLQKLLRAGHARCLRYQRRAKLYHVTGRAVYMAVGRPHSRLARGVPLDRVVERLMLLDFVMADPVRHILTSERERLGYVTNVAKATESDLKGLTVTSTDRSGAVQRRLIDPTPLVVSGQDGGRPSFVYLHTPSRRAGHFEAFLARHQALFRRLGQVRIVFCTPWASAFFDAEKAILPRGGRGAPVGQEPTTIRIILAHFDARRRFEKRQYWTLSTDEVERLRLDLERFGGEPYEEIYLRWASGEASTDDTRRRLIDAVRGYGIDLVAYVLPFVYPLADGRRRARKRPACRSELLH